MLWKAEILVSLLKYRGGKRRRQEDADDEERDRSQKREALQQKLSWKDYNNVAKTVATKINENGILNNLFVSLFNNLFGNSVYSHPYLSFIICKKSGQNWTVSSMTQDSLNENVDIMGNKEQREEAIDNGFLTKTEFKNLKNQFVVMRIQLLFNSKSTLAHSNILVIDQVNNKAYFFEPYATTTNKPKDRPYMGIYNKVKEYVKTLNDNIIMVERPKFERQIQEDDELCQSWVLYYAYLRISEPYANETDLYEKMRGSTSNIHELSKEGEQILRNTPYDTYVGKSIKVTGPFNGFDAVPNLYHFLYEKVFPVTISSSRRPLNFPWNTRPEERKGLEFNPLFEELFQSSK